MEQHAEGGAGILRGGNFLMGDDRARSVIRSIMGINFLMLLLALVPATRNWMDRFLLRLRTIGLEDAVGWSIPVWFLGSTVLASVLLGHIVWRDRNPEAENLTRRLGFEGKVLLGWWLVLFAVCIYGYSLGIGG